MRMIGTRTPATVPGVDLVTEENCRQADVFFAFKDEVEPWMGSFARAVSWIYVADVEDVNEFISELRKFDPPVNQDLGH